MGASAIDALDVVRTELGDPSEWDHGERVVATDLHYADGEPVSVHIRKRGRRYELDDEGAAVAKARWFGASDWEGRATEIVDAHDLNLNRRGVVFAPGIAGGPDLAWLAFKLARCSYAVHSELLETSTRA
jgi:hypothetical protein